MPIFCRLTLNGKRKQFSTGFFIKEGNWNGQTQRHRGTSVDSQHVNIGLESIRVKLLKAHDAISKNNSSFTVEHVYNRYAERDKEYKSLLQAFEYHNEKMKELVGKDYVKATYDKFVVIQNHIEDFIKFVYNLTDYPLVEVKLKFLHDLDHYLKVTKGHNQNTINKVV
ncbi:hypothetical protein DJ568_16450 [Mucilaginibacter hurinus]|uniref:Phage integrase SAM-like domain-containing protein n=2 Tax=Mucilaginibacter hurinus TaxID=2201324 RepID=A0A367GLD3_9SPHI|nr:hypothetical protein DJ568_16450 [Mucilaginibacter hurinus]